MPKQILSCYSDEERLEYEDWKKKIGECGFVGAKKLVKRLQKDEGANDKENFLNTLCEFNIARKLLIQKKEFKYENGGDDFSFNNIILSVKSLQAKNYEKEEQKIIEDLQKISFKSSLPQQRIIQHSELSAVELEVKPNMFERCEIGKPGGQLHSEMKHKGKILEYLADFEFKELEQEKVIFFFRQTNGLRDIWVKAIASWYFGKILKNDFNLKFYPKMFKTNTGIVDKRESIKAIIYLKCPTNVLFWPIDTFKKENFEIFKKDKNMEYKLREVFN